MRLAVHHCLTQDNFEVDSKDNQAHFPLCDTAGKGHEAVVKILVAWDNVEVDSK